MPSPFHHRFYFVHVLAALAAAACCLELDLRRNVYLHPDKVRIKTVKAS
jgi:hypothetical protein